jgi:hypothetical protein
MVLSALLGACNSSKHGITEGRYQANGHAVQVQVLNDTIALLPLDSTAGDRRLLVLPPVVPTAQRPPRHAIYQHSFDVDVLTTLLKYRPAQDGAQPQLETQLSAALFLGRRTDHYNYSYPVSPFPRTERKEGHWGLSGGAILGLSGAPINPWVTHGRVEAEYTGVVLGYGAACIGAVGSTTVGLALGWDHLLDENATRWIYEDRPWLGLVLGLNLN